MSWREGQLELWFWRSLCWKWWGEKNCEVNNTFTIAKLNYSSVNVRNSRQHRTVLSLSLACQKHRDDKHVFKLISQFATLNSCVFSLFLLHTQDPSSSSPSKAAPRRCSRGRWRRPTVNRKPHNHRETTMWILWIILVIIRPTCPSRPVRWRTLLTCVINV